MGEVDIINDVAILQPAMRQGLTPTPNAQVAELVDALASGASDL